MSTVLISFNIYSYKLILIKVMYVHAIRHRTVLSHLMFVSFILSLLFDGSLFNALPKLYVALIPF